jgi:hypothetical protein
MSTMKEYWVMHRPRHPVWGTMLFATTGVTPVASPNPGITQQLYTGDEKDYVFYKYSGTGAPQFYAVPQKTWLQHTVCNSMEDAIIAAKRLISFVGQDNVRIARVIMGNVKIEF